MSSFQGLQGACPMLLVDAAAGARAVMACLVGAGLAGGDLERLLSGCPEVLLKECAPAAAPSARLCPRSVAPLRVSLIQAACRFYGMLCEWAVRPGSGNHDVIAHTFRPGACGSQDRLLLNPLNACDVQLFMRQD